MNFLRVGIALSLPNLQHYRFTLIHKSQCLVETLSMRVHTLLKLNTQIKKLLKQFLNFDHYTFLPRNLKLKSSYCI